MNRIVSTCEAQNTASPVTGRVINVVPSLPRDDALSENCFGSPGGWEIEIKRLWAGRRSNTLELAQVVYAAKRKLLYGQWTGLFKSGCIPFAKRTAEMLVVIARGLARLDAHNYAHLPSALNTLHRLAQLPHAVLVSLIAEGTIHPGLTRNLCRNRSHILKRLFFAGHTHF